MKVLHSERVELQRVETKSGAKLWKIQLEKEGDFLLEQNPKKDSIFGRWYRVRKEVDPDFYLFWEFKNGEYTGRVLRARFQSKQELEREIEELLKGQK
ncbi:MAG: hypothetical protein ABGW77_02970 [Campylobacterales bacterium]